MIVSIENIVESSCIQCFYPFGLIIKNLITWHKVVAFHDWRESKVGVHETSDIYKGAINIVSFRIFVLCEQVFLI